MRGYDYGRGDEGTRWNQGKKGIEKEVWQRKNWSYRAGEEKEKRRNKGNTGKGRKMGEVWESKGAWDTKGYKGRGVGKRIKKAER
jgi:hypothetical protein